MGIKLRNFVIGAPADKSDSRSIAASKLTILAGPCAIEDIDILRRTADVLSNICQELGINYIFKSSFVPSLVVTPFLIASLILYLVF